MTTNEGDKIKQDEVREQVNDQNKMPDIEKFRRKYHQMDEFDKFTAYFKGTFYLVLTGLMWCFYLTPGIRENAKYTIGNTIRYFSEKPLSSRKISESLNLEDELGKYADNVVRITSEGGIGNGVLVNPFSMYTAYHVIQKAFETGKPIYIQSQSYLAQNESNRVNLKEDDVRYNQEADIAMVTLTTPIFGAEVLEFLHGSIPLNGASIKYIGYRDKELINTTGIIKASTYYAPVFHFTDLNAGPGMSGGPVFVEINKRFYLAGIASMAPKEKKEYNQFDSSNLIFTDIRNSL